MLGLLVIAVDPRGFVAGDYVQFLRIEGTELTDPIRDQKEIAGPLQESLMPMAQEARKPMFHLKAADGALGAHAKAVEEAGRDFAGLAKSIAERSWNPKRWPVR